MYSILIRELPISIINYGQGKSDLSGLNVHFAQNINPWWNVNVLYRREGSSGTYSEFQTTHNNIVVATNVRSRNERYHAFGNFMFQEFGDELNGGVAQIDSIQALFNKGSQPVSLTDAVLIKRQQSLFFKHYYSLTNPNDSVERANKFLIHNSVMRDYFNNEFQDTSISATIQEYSYPVYLTLADTVDSFWEQYTHQRWTVTGGATYRFRKRSFSTTPPGGSDPGNHRFPEESDRPAAQ